MPEHDLDLLTQARLDLDTDAVRSASIDLASAVAATPRQRRRTSKRVALGLAALAVAVPTTAAATGTWPDLHTGIFGQPDKFTEDAGTSEYLNLCSPGYLDVVRRHQPDGPLPAGASWQDATARQVALAEANTDCGPGGTGAVQQEIGVDSWFAHYARCAWLGEAVAAKNAGNDVRRERAGQELMTLADSDLNHTIDGGGVVAWDTRIAEDVLSGDVREAAQSVRANCDEAR